MNITALLNDLTRDEGFRSHVYRDSEGFWTIGFGRMVDESLGGGITEDEARVLLDNDVKKTIGELDASLPWWRNQPDAVQRGLCNMAFNLGMPRLRGFRKMLGALQNGDYEKAADEALKSRWARQVGARADRIANLFRTADGI